MSGTPAGGSVKESDDAVVDAYIARQPAHLQPVLQ
jgi:hypothetical protein